MIEKDSFSSDRNRFTSVNLFLNPFSAGMADQ
jgi:hypothetical protein